MPTKETIQKRVADATAAYSAAGAEVGRLTALIKTESQAIEKLTADHTAACRAIASDKSADTAAILAEKSRRAERLQGLEQLLKEAREEETRLSLEFTQANRALEVEIDREETERLQAALDVANQNQLRAAQAVKDADLAVRAASHAKEQHRKLVERKTRTAA